MPEIDLMRVDHCIANVKLNDSNPPNVAPGYGGFDGCCSTDVKVKLEEDSDCLKKSASRSTRRGRPPKTLVAKASPSQSRKRREDEDVCFVCFDGGSLVLCDRRGCPKAYHPTCVKRTEAFFKSRAKWNCGWHICTACQKDSFYMCYTCPYSVCKRCVRSSEYVVIRENKGFCRICMKTIMLIENADEANIEKVDFDDKGSWEYLFKIYWVSLKEKMSLTLDDLTNAKNPWKSFKRRITSLVQEKNGGKVRKMEAVCVSKLDSSLDLDRSLGDRLPALTSASAWATDELIDFVGFMKKGDTSFLSKYDVQTLVLEHVRRNNLQNSSQNSEIMCDTKLMRLFKKERVDHLEILKLLDSHFLDKERSQVTDTSAGGDSEIMSFQVGANRSCNRLNTSEQHQGESKQLNMHNRPSSFDSTNLAAVNSEACATPSNEPIYGLDTNSIWLYGDLDGKIHGPFSLFNLQKWNSSGHFPPELRIWRFDEQKNSSILLTDALNGQFDKTDSFIPKPDITANDNQNMNVVVAKVENRALDFSPNSVCTEQSVISNSNSVITRSSDASNKTGPLDYALFNETKHESPLLGQNSLSCIDLSGTGEKQQVTATVQSCGQNWNAATPSSGSNVWESNNSGLVSFTDNEEIDFRDFFSSTFKLNFDSTTTTTTTTEWQPIVAGADESVSDLLAEVESMESQKRHPSPTSTFRGRPGEINFNSINDPRDVSKGDSMSSSNDLQMHLRYNDNTMDFWP